MAQAKLLRLWDAEAVFDLRNDEYGDYITCSAITQKGYRCCKMPSTNLNSFLRRLESLTPSTAAMSPILEDAAEASVCHMHWGQVDGIESIWSAALLRCTKSYTAPSNPSSETDPSTDSAKVKVEEAVEEETEDEPNWEAQLNLKLENMNLKVSFIIFIHGLQGHPFNTWAAEVDGANSTVLNKLSGKARGLFSKKPASEALSATDKNRIFWPRDLLSDDCPRARISVFGYNTVVAKHQLAGAANKNSVFAHSRDLVNELCRRRPLGRPTIFVTHSLGGILIKEALAACSTSNDVDVRDILESTAGIVFMGTPHRGSSAAGIGEIARKAASVLLMDTNSLILDSLALKNSDLARCQEIFSALWHKHKFAVKTFQEGLPLKLPIKIGQSKMIKASLPIVVPDESSCLGDARERAETLTGDHRSICRFSTKDDPNYRKVATDLINQYSSLLPKSDSRQGNIRLDHRFPEVRDKLQRDPSNPTGNSSRHGKLDLLKYNEMLLRQDSIKVLEDLFTEMLKDINPEDVEVTLRLFQWAVLATDRLRIREWHHILAFIRDRPPLSLEEWGTSEFYTETDVELARQIRRLSKGLIEIHSGNIEVEVSEEVVDDIASHLPGAGSLDSNNGDSRFVQTIHESVGEFFISDRANRLFGKPDSYDFVREGHQTITTTCLEYVQIREFDDLTPEIDDWIAPSEVVIFKRLPKAAGKSHSDLTEEIVISTGLMALLDNRIKERSDHSCTDSRTQSCPQDSLKTSEEDFTAIKASLVQSWWQLNSMPEPWRGTLSPKSPKDRNSEDEDDNDPNSKRDYRDGLTTSEFSVRSRVLAALPYASQMTFMSIRGPIVAGMNVTIVFGQLITYGVIRETRKLGDSLIYKMLFAMQFVFLSIGILVRATAGGDDRPGNDGQAQVLGRISDSVREKHS
ncbi:hypothetical protein F5X68DRAFT_257264 [Plectosphaerella plurivora]|uniref:DUF676 domain-containing protein n=1 Tax=Plectosphaerella plurivora TaxID=936078 RepID=A0A9P8VMP9_9PEZI|nr:hypothetical protein F5X68DRAFT_257264 [Plectosphaerella plurivora]